MAATTTTTTPTSAPAIAPAGDPLTGDLSEPGVGRRDNAGVKVTGGGVLPGFGSMVGTRSPVLLLTGTVEGIKVCIVVVNSLQKQIGCFNH